MTVLSGARVVTPGGVLDPATIVLENGRIADVQPGMRGGDRRLEGHLIVPGFVDVHVHGVAGLDSLAGGDAVARIARTLPRHGVTAFCPTTVACSPAALTAVLEGVARSQSPRGGRSARVLGAHLESNFINPDFRGAQPLANLRTLSDDDPRQNGAFTARDVLDVIARFRPEVAIVTLAPELDGALDLIRSLAASGHRVSLGHSAATYEQGLDGFDAGARHATHLFNRMPPFSHRAPGLVGSVFQREDVTAELIVDGHHVHPAAGRAAIRALGADRAIAITDGTAVSGLPVGSSAHLGGARLTAGPHVALLDDGTWAGSVLTMDAAFRNLMTLYGCSLETAVRLCSTNPSRALGAATLGSIVPGAAADLVVLDGALRVVRTYIDGEAVHDVREPGR